MIIDFHTHIFPPEMHERREHYAQRDRTFGALYADPRARIASAEDLIATMDEDGVDVSVAMGIGWSDYGAAREANDYIIEATSRWQARIVGFSGINPAWGDRRSAGSRALRRRGTTRHRRTAPGYTGLRSRAQERDGQTDGSRPGTPPHRNHPLFRTRRPPVHRQGNRKPAGPDALHQQLPGRDNRMRPLGRRSALLRPHARGRYRAAQRLFRHRRIALPLQPAGLCGSIIARRRRQGTLRQRLRPAAPPPSAQRNRRIHSHPARTRSRTRWKRRSGYLESNWPSAEKSQTSSCTRAGMSHRPPAQSRRCRRSPSAAPRLRHP